MCSELLTIRRLIFLRKGHVALNDMLNPYPAN
jgi:hypothetical protein